ncbi:MAG: endonuclease [Clostridia bacterium]|nr:endonuclease [Clostridia bacterium]
MIHTTKRSVALLLALVMCVAFLPMLQINASAEKVTYVYDGKYIYNWGTRGETATFLSPNAEAFYTGERTYATLSAYVGGTDAATAPTSPLYVTLQNVMASAHTHITDYGETRPLYQYTDCEKSGGAISAFYSGKAVGPAWDGGKTWNREHTWPNSKGMNGDDENDIMMLRPASSSVNSSRGNDAYGQSAGYYNPNKASNGALDLRGDVARIFLYVYVRWGNLNSAWGSSGVMESVEVLLAWMEADPVDTWELGRNDSVQAITGTRNVFVDYPEFAFLLFGADIPDTMTTPSGEGDDRCEHNNFKATVTAPTCMAAGFTTYTCQTPGCGYVYKADMTPKADHAFVDGVCTVCKAVQFGIVEAPVAGKAYKFGMVQSNVSATDVYYLAGGMNGYYMATTKEKDSAIDVYLEETAGGYYLYTLSGGSKTYINMVTNDTHVNGAYEATAKTVYTYDTATKTIISQVNGEPYRFGTRNDKHYTTVGPVAVSYKGFYCQFYGDSAGGSEQPACNHTNTTLQGKQDATCTSDGHTGNTVCTDCGATVSHGSVIKSPGHDYQNGSCSVCGAAISTEQKVTITFDADKNNRTEYSTSLQVWVQNGITVTNNKGSSTSNVGDYTNPGRFYKSSSVTISCEGMVQIEIDCTGLESKYVDPWLNVPTGVTATKSNGIVTIVFAEPVDSLTYSTLSAQARAYSMTVTCAAAAPACEHANGTWAQTKAPTCTEKGEKTFTCTDCGATLTEEIAATGHSHKAVVTPPTCTEKGYTTHTCSCGDTYVTDEVAALGHKDENGNGACDACGTTLTPATEATEATTAPSTDATTAPATNASTNAGTSEKKGCAGTFGATSVGVILLIGTGAVMFFKKKED